LLGLASATAWAANPPYPARPIRLFVPYAPGGAGDIVARLLARKLGERMGQPVVVENRPGPWAAMATVAKAPADGYTLVMTTSGTALSSVLFKNPPYDLMGDFAHISTLATFDLVLLTGGRSNFQSATQVLAYAKANPGKLNIATIQPGSTQHLAAELFKAMAGINAVVVPYKSTADVVLALRSGEVQLALEILPPVLGQIAGKELKALALTSAHRFAGLPDVPTLAEAALPGFEASSWNGISAPGKTPQPLVDRLAAEIAAVIGQADVQQELQALGMVARASSPVQMAAHVKADMDKWKSVIAKAGLQQP
jgi:tripartite-type tricarboxylate transporter receptor subunit TctC